MICFVYSFLFCWKVSLTKMVEWGVQKVEEEENWKKRWQVLLVFRAQRFRSFVLTLNLTAHSWLAAESDLNKIFNNCPFYGGHTLSQQFWCNLKWALQWLWFIVWWLLSSFLNCSKIVSQSGDKCSVPDLSLKHGWKYNIQRYYNNHTTLENTTNWGQFEETFHWRLLRSLL